SGERVGGGLAADGMGELSRLLLGGNPRKALRLARDTGVLVALIPEFAPALGYDPKSSDHDMSLDEHVVAVVQGAAAAGMPLRVRLATLLHDIGKPAAVNDDHDDVGADLADDVLRRLRYPSGLTRRVVEIVRFHVFRPGAGDALEARRLLARHGDELALDLIDHWEADVRGRDLSESVRAKLDWLRRFRAVVEEERASPHRLADLAVDGDDLIELGYRPGPTLGRVLDDLLEAVVEQPALNRRETLLG